jgi:hypothetical protein
MPLEDDLSSAPAQPTGMASLFQNKWALIGIGALVLVVFLMKGKGGTKKSSGGRSGARGQAGAEGTEGNIDPATGDPYGSSADVAALRTYGALGGGGRYNMGAAPKSRGGTSWGTGNIGLGGGFLPPYEPLSNVYYHGIATPAYPIGPAGPPGVGNTGATGDNFADLLTASQSLTTQSTIPVNEKSYNHTRVYRVKPGDNLAGIAAKFGVAGGYPTLFKLNQHQIGPNPDFLVPGTLIYL